MPHAYEIKSGGTFSPDFFKNIAQWAKLSATPADRCTAIYTGNQSLKTQQEEVKSWQ